MIRDETKNKNKNQKNEDQTQNKYKLEDTIKFIKALHVYRDKREKRMRGGKRPIITEPPLRWQHTPP